MVEKLKEIVCWCQSPVVRKRMAAGFAALLVLGLAHPMCWLVALGAMLGLAGLHTH